MSLFAATWVFPNKWEARLFMVSKGRQNTATTSISTRTCGTLSKSLRQSRDQEAVCAEFKRLRNSDGTCAVAKRLDIAVGLSLGPHMVMNSGSQTTWAKGTMRSRHVLVWFPQVMCGELPKCDMHEGCLSSRWRTSHGFSVSLLSAKTCVSPQPSCLPANDQHYCVLVYLSFSTFEAVAWGSLHGQ